MRDKSTPSSRWPRFPLSVFATVAICTITISCSKSTIKSQTGKTISGTEKTIAGKTAAIEPVNTTPDFRVAADVFAAEFKADRKAARKKYFEKVVELTGKVAYSGREVSGKPFIAFVPGKNLFGDLRCSTKDQLPWLRVLQGQHAVVRGTYKSYFGGASLDDVEIVEVSQAPTAVKATVKKLYAEFNDDRIRTGTRYKGKQIVITGTLRLADASGKELALESGTAHVAIKMAAALDLRNLSDGQTVTIAGRYRMYTTNYSRPEIDSAVVVSPVQRLNVDPPQTVGGDPHFTADQIATMFQKAPREFASRYKGREIRIEGVLAKVEIDRNGATVSFKNSLNHRISAAIPSFGKNSAVAGLTANKRVTLKGKYLAISVGLTKPDDEINLILCQQVRE